MALNSQDTLREFRENIINRDINKAPLILDQIDQIADRKQKSILLQLSKIEDDFALPLLARIFVRHQDLITKYPTLKELLLNKAENNPESILNYLETATRDRKTMSGWQLPRQ